MSYGLYPNAAFGGHMHSPMAYYPPTQYPQPSYYTPSPSASCTTQQPIQQAVYRSTSVFQQPQTVQQSIYSSANQVMTPRGAQSIYSSTSQMLAHRGALAGNSFPGYPVQQQQYYYHHHQQQPQFVYMNGYLYPYQPFGYPWGQFAFGGGYYQPNYMYQSMFGGANGFDPRMFVLPNAIRGYGDPNLQFPGLTFDQGAALKSRIASTGMTFKERSSLYQSMPGKANDARKANESIYSSSDGVATNYERPPSIAPGSPPAQFAPSPIQEESSAAASLMSAIFGIKPKKPTEAVSARPATQSASPAPQKSASVPPRKATSLQPVVQEIPKFRGGVESAADTASSSPKEKAASPEVASPSPAKASPGPAVQQPIIASSPPPKASTPIAAEPQASPVKSPLASLASLPPPNTSASPAPSIPASVQSLPAMASSQQPPVNVLFGVGLLFSQDEVGGGRMGWVVRKVIDGSPAGKAGNIKVGDELSTVDGQPVAGLESMFELSKLLLGLEGSKTALAFKKKEGGKKKAAASYTVRLVRSNTFAGSEGAPLDAPASAEPGGSLEV